MDGLDLLVVQGTLRSLFQHHISKASILRCSDFFTVQTSHPYMTTGKTIALTRWAFVGKVMSLVFNMLSKLVITFLPRSKCPLISWLQSPSAVILEPPKIKSDTISTVSPSISMNDGTRCHDLNKASGGDGIPIELFQILKDDTVKVLHSICQQNWKTQQWSQDWKSQFSFKSQRKAVLKNAQNTAQLHSSHRLVK